MNDKKQPPLRHLHSQLTLEQREVAYFKIKLAAAIARRNETFQALQQVTFGFKPGDRITYQGREKLFRGKVTGYACADESERDLTKVLLWFDSDEGPGFCYNIDPKDAKRE